MTDAFYITVHKGAQAAADVLGVKLLFQGAPKFDPERQVSVSDADSFHQVEHMVDKIGRLLGGGCTKNAGGWSFSVAPFHSLEYNLALPNSILPRS
jgi:hypothetical protein